MKRKLISVMLSVFAMLLLMGAAANSEPSAALLAEEESVVLDAALETEANMSSVAPSFEAGPGFSAGPSFEVGPGYTVGGVPAADSVVGGSTEGREPEVSVPAIPEIPTTPVVPVIPDLPGALDGGLFINGQPAPAELNRELQNGVTYVSLSVLARQLAPGAQISWDGAAATVVTDRLSLSAEVGKLYIVANGRYLYVPETVQLTSAGQVIVPLRVAAKAFDAQVGYDSATRTTTVTSGSGTIQGGDSFYNQEDLFWLSRVIHRESGNQPLEGMMAVGNVVLNRVADPVFPDTVEGVLAQKNQFSTYKSGVLAETNPSERSIIAAKLVMDGGVVEETKGALYFDSGSTSWAARNKELIATIGGHKFYG